jgi:hypothetical protein
MLEEDNVEREDNIRTYQLGKVLKLNCKTTIQKSEYVHVQHLLPYSTGIPEEMQSFESAPPLITLSPLHQSAHST